MPWILKANLKGPAGTPGTPGAPGAPGAPGSPGAVGPANQISVGTVVAGAAASASLTGLAPAQKLNLTLPQGAKGDRGAKGDIGKTGPANRLSVGTVAVGTSPGVALTGTAPEQKINLTLPRGPQGLPGTNAVPADAAVAGYISTEGESLTRTALLAAVAEAFPTVIAPEPTGADDTMMLDTFVAANAGKVLSLRTAATYITPNGLTLPTKTFLLGNYATLDCTGMADADHLSQRYAIRSDGTLGDTVLVDAPITKWGKTVTNVNTTPGIAASGLVAGDMVLISNGERPVIGMTRTDRSKGELNEIASVDSPTQVTLRYGALFDYASTDLAIRKVTPVEGVGVESLNILMGGVDSAHNGVQVAYGRDITIDRVSVDGAEDTALGLRAVLNGRITNSTARHSTSSTKTGPNFGPTGYGAVVWDGSRHIAVEDSYFYDCRHFVAGGGAWPPAFVDVKGNDGQRASSAGYDCHEPCHYWTFDGNTVEGATHGFYLRGQYITARNNEISDCSGEAFAVHTFDGVQEQRGIRVIDNTANRTGYGLSVGRTGSEYEYVSYDVEVTGNKFTDCGTNPIRLRNFIGAKVGGNTINGGAGHSIRLEGASSTVRSSKLTMWANDINGAAQCAYDLRYIDDINLVGGTADTPGQYPLQMTDCNDTITSAFKGIAGGYGGIFISGGARHQVNGCEMRCSTNAGIADGVRADASADVTVIGGIYAQARWAVWTTNTDGVIVQLVNARNSGSKIKVDNATSQSVSNNLI